MGETVAAVRHEPLRIAAARRTSSVIDIAGPPQTARRPDPRGIRPVTPW
ncbi:hypothetical protein [Mumia zhuanghuii]|nr:hypothetical protein [Mumia zhuanghuii]